MDYNLRAFQQIAYYIQLVFLQIKKDNSCQWLIITKYFTTILTTSSSSSSPCWTHTIQTHTHVHTQRHNTTQLCVDDLVRVWYLEQCVYVCLDNRTEKKQSRWENLHVPRLLFYLKIKVSEQCKLQITVITWPWAPRRQLTRVFPPLFAHARQALVNTIWSILGMQGHLI